MGSFNIVIAREASVADQLAKAMFTGYDKVHSLDLLYPILPKEEYFKLPIEQRLEMSQVASRLVTEGQKAIGADEVIVFHMPGCMKKINDKFPFGRPLEYAFDHLPFPEKMSFLTHRLWAEIDHEERLSPDKRLFVKLRDNTDASGKLVILDTVSGEVYEHIPADIITWVNTRRGVESTPVVVDEVTVTDGRVDPSVEVWPAKGCRLLPGETMLYGSAPQGGKTVTALMSLDHIVKNNPSTSIYPMTIVHTDDNCHFERQVMELIPAEKASSVKLVKVKNPNEIWRNIGIHSKVILMDGVFAAHEDPLSIIDHIQQFTGNRIIIATVRLTSTLDLNVSRSWMKIIRSIPRLTSLAPHPETAVKS